MRPKLRTRLFNMSAFEMMICSPVSLRNRVVLMPMCSTLPMNASMVRLSPTTKGLSSAIDSEANRSPRYVLQCQSHRNAADTEAGEQRGDIDAEIVERDQDHQRPDQHARNEIDDIQGTRKHPIRAALAVPSFPNRSARTGRPTGRSAAG